MNKNMDLQSKTEKIIAKMPNKTFCPAPFLHSYINANNRGYKLCCMSHVIGRWDNERNLAEQHKEWWQGQEMRDVRSSFLKGEMPDPCKWWCGRWEKEKIYHESDRFHFLKKYAAEFEDLESFEWDVELGTKNFKKPIDIDLRPSKLCNLKCRSCNSLWSSEIEKEVLAHPEIQKWTHWDMVTISAGAMKKAKSIDWSDVNFDVVSNLDLSDVRWLKISGGETLIDPRVNKVLSRIVEAGYSGNMRLHIITNCTVMSEQIKNLLLHFKELTFNISVDGIGKTDEFLRHGTVWEKKQKVFDDIFSLPNLKWAGIMHVTQPISVLQIRRNVEWFLEGYRKYKQKHIGVTFNPVVDPWYLSPGWLDDDHKQFVLSEVDHLIKSHDMQEDEIWWFDTLKSELNRDFGALKERYANDFVRAQLALDKIRKTDTLSIEPELRRYFDRYNPADVSEVDEKTKKPAAMFPQGKPSV